MRHTGAFLLIVPGSGGLERWGCEGLREGSPGIPLGDSFSEAPSSQANNNLKLCRLPSTHPNLTLACRRTEGQPFLSVDTTAAGGHLGAALGPAAAALEAMISAAEAALGRRLFAFRLETAPLPPCAAGTGPCAVWEASSGRVVLDAGLAATMAGISGTAGAAGAPAELAGPEQAASTSAGLPQLLAGFVGKLAEQLEPAVALLQDEQVRTRLGRQVLVGGRSVRAQPAACLCLLAWLYWVRPRTFLALYRCLCHPWQLSSLKAAQQQSPC